MPALQIVDIGPFTARQTTLEQHLGGIVTALQAGDCASRASASRLPGSSSSARANASRALPIADC